VLFAFSNEERQQAKDTIVSLIKKYI
jgi:hypothetical protein